MGRVERVVMPDGAESWTVLDDDGEVVAPVEAFLAHLQALDGSPTTIRTATTTTFYNTDYVGSSGPKEPGRLQGFAREFFTRSGPAAPLSGPAASGDGHNRTAGAEGTTRRHRRTRKLNGHRQRSPAEYVSADLYGAPGVAVRIMERALCVRLGARLRMIGRLPTKNSSGETRAFPGPQWDGTTYPGATLCSSSEPLICMGAGRFLVARVPLEVMTR